MDRLIEIERSIIKRYRKYIWAPFIDAINSYKLIEDNDKICVVINGTVNSFLLAKCMQEIKKHGKMVFDLFYVVVGEFDITQTDIIKINLEVLNIKADFLPEDTLIETALKNQWNKIAVESKVEDVTIDILYNLLEEGKIKTILPKETTNNRKTTIIRPMFTIKEKGVALWEKSTQLNFIDYVDTNSTKKILIKKLIDELKQNNDLADTNIFKSVHNVNLNTVISYIENGEVKHFLDDYDY